MKGILEIKDELDEIMTEFMLDTNSENKVIEIQKKTSALFTSLEDNLCQKINKGDDLSKTELEDFLSTIENIFDFAIKYSEFIKIWSKQRGVSYEYSSNVLSTSESVLKYYRKERADYYKEKFKENNFPTRGFERKLSMRNKTKDVLCIIFGSVLFFVSVLMAYLFDVNTGYQYLVFRTCFSFGVALLASGLLKGFIKTKIKTNDKINRIEITACGAAAVFLLLYLINPAEPPQIDNTTKQTEKILEQK
jgi:hypothetical protein